MSVEIVSSIAEQYVARHTSPESEVLKKISEETLQTHPHAHMLSGHVQGKFLSLLSQLIQPKFVLEIGTFTGYSAVCLLQGVKDDGELHTIELREEDAATARKHFEQVDTKRIILHVGNAKEIIPELSHEWDLVFLDADKVNYVEYYELVLPRLSQKGLIIADNVLFHGQVLEDPVRGKNAIAIDNFNKHVSNDPRVEHVMLSLRDGLSLIKKK